MRISRCRAPDTSTSDRGDPHTARYGTSTSWHGTARRSGRGDAPGLGRHPAPLGNRGPATGRPVARWPAGRRHVGGDAACWPSAVGAVADRPIVAQSARNRFPGIVTRIEKDRVAAVVEVMAGPHRLVSLMTAEAVDDWGSRSGTRPSCVVKATNVIVEIPAQGARRWVAEAALPRSSCRWRSSRRARRPGRPPPSPPPPPRRPRSRSS